MGIMRSQLLIAALSMIAISSRVGLSEEKSVIVGFKRWPGLAEESLIHKAKGTIERGHRLIPAMTVSLTDAEIEKLKKNGDVAYIESNAVYSLATTPSVKKEFSNSWGVAGISADVAHAMGNRGAGVKIAILDTGIDYTHPDLAENYIRGYDFVFDDYEPLDDNYLSHGTHVAGIIAAREDGVGVIGVAPEAKILAAKVLDGGGFGTADWIVAGIEWSVANGADIINMSFAGPDSQALRDACDAARCAGVLLVAAGGNSFTGGQPVQYPAAYDSVIAVTATDAYDTPGYFAPADDKVELSAPGVDIYSSVAGGKYATISGTSQASPHVTGAAALFLRFNTRDLNNDGLVDCEDVRLLLQATAVDLGIAGKDPIFGYGLVNAGRAIAGGGDNSQTLELLVNGADDFRQFKRTDVVSVDFSVRAGQKKGMLADWWILRAGPNGLFSWNGKKWVYGLKPWRKQSATVNVLSKNVMKSRLSPGFYTFWVVLYLADGAEEVVCAPLYVSR
jgi:subtilisin